ncbi:MAG: metallophosphoesterase family protein, partial [Anaerolineales bacterium]|nr:metallophosphoesterase family protein [Anaerolineales bacterium]
LNFDFFSTVYCLVGHTHVPVWFEEEDVYQVVPRMPEYGQTMQLAQNRLIINPGSVGQPRDSDPRAAYALLNTETLAWEYRRVPYDISKVQARMRACDMPARLVNRLEYGW